MDVVIHTYWYFSSDLCLGDNCVLSVGTTNPIMLGARRKYEYCQ